MINLGEVAGGVRLFWAESVAGVINWSLAAPLFSINYVLLDAGLQRSLRPIKTLVSPSGIEGLVEQGVRVLRWGLSMAPIVNSFLRQSRTRRRSAQALSTSPSIPLGLTSVLIGLRASSASQRRAEHKSSRRAALRATS